MASCDLERMHARSHVAPLARSRPVQATHATSGMSCISKALGDDVGSVRTCLTAQGRSSDLDHTRMLAGPLSVFGGEIRKRQVHEPTDESIFLRPARQDMI